MEVTVTAPENDEIPSVARARSQVANATLVVDVVFADDPASVPECAANSLTSAVLTCFDPLDPRSRVELELLEQSGGHALLPIVVDKVLREQQRKNQRPGKSGERGAFRAPFVLQTEFLMSKSSEVSLAGSFKWRQGHTNEEDSRRVPSRSVTLVDVPLDAADRETDRSKKCRSRAFGQMLEFSEKWDEFAVLLLSMSAAAGVKPASPALWQHLLAVLSRSPFLDEELVTKIYDRMQRTEDVDPESDDGIAESVFHGHSIRFRELIDTCRSSIARVRDNIAAWKSAAAVKKQYADFRAGKPCESHIFRGVHGWILRHCARAVLTQGSDPDIVNPMRTASFMNTYTKRHTLLITTPVFLPNATPAAAMAQFETSGTNQRGVSRLYRSKATPSFDEERKAMKTAAIKGDRYLTCPPDVTFFDSTQMVTLVGGNPNPGPGVVSLTFEPYLSLMPGLFNSKFRLGKNISVLRQTEQLSAVARADLDSAGNDVFASAEPDTRFYAAVRPQRADAMLIEGVPSTPTSVLGRRAHDGDNREQDDGKRYRPAAISVPAAPVATFVSVPGQEHGCWDLSGLSNDD